MLKISPAEIIAFSKVGNELIGTVDIVNIMKYPITYKVKLFNKLYHHEIFQVNIIIRSKQHLPRNSEYDLVLGSFLLETVQRLV